MATVCTLTRKRSRTWFYSLTTHILRDRRTLPCCSCWRSGIGSTGSPRLELSLWTSSPVCCGTGSNCPPQTLPGFRQRCRLSVPSSPTRWNTKQPNYVANKWAGGQVHRWRSSYHTGLMMVKSNSGAVQGTFGGHFHCRHGSQECVWDGHVSFSYKFVQHCRIKEDFTKLAS